jgi:hypothetical protein
MGYNVYYRGEVTITPPLTEEHAGIVRAFASLESNERIGPIFAAVAASPAPDLPYHAGLFDLSEDGSTILPEEGESRHGLILWLTLLVEHVFRSSGYVLNGGISWNGDDTEDRGSIFIRDNLIEIVDDLIVNGGPSWSPEYYADGRLKQILQSLVDSADNTGCSPDLTVVAAEPFEVLRGVLAELES